MSRRDENMRSSPTLVRAEVPRVLKDTTSHLGVKASKIAGLIEDWRKSEEWDVGLSVSITGDRGSGKSTLLRTVLDVLNNPKNGGHYESAYVDPEVLQHVEDDRVLPALLMALRTAIEPLMPQTATKPCDAEKQSDLDALLLFPLVADRRASAEWIAAISGDMVKMEERFVQRELRRVKAVLDLRKNLGQVLRRYLSAKRAELRGAIILAVDDLDLVSRKTLPLLRALTALREVPGLVIIVAAQPETLKREIGASLHHRKKVEVDLESEDLLRKTLGSANSHISHLTHARMEEFFSSPLAGAWAQEVVRAFFSTTAGSATSLPSSWERWFDWLDEISAPAALQKREERAQRRILDLIEPHTYRALVGALNEIATRVEERRAGEHAGRDKASGDEWKQSVRVFLVSLLFRCHRDNSMSKLLFRDMELLDDLAKAIGGFDSWQGRFVLDPKFAGKAWNAKMIEKKLNLSSYGWEVLQQRTSLTGNPWAFAAWYFRGILGINDSPLAYERRADEALHVTDGLKVVLEPHQRASDKKKSKTKTARSGRRPPRT